MTRREERRKRVIALCEEMVHFMGELDMREAQKYYRKQADALRSENTYFGRRRRYRDIFLASNSGAGGLGDAYITRPDGTGDVPATNAFRDCLSRLLKATYTIP
ncbi:hypothetical protein DEJ25_00215 [Curtobacterium sp. MCPF17_011]|uniref:hypothetical protein n=1 Tax=Curtobacterium sp. MCPF17_011 TaxID=2175652 RepID=UPI000DA80A9C|nr:hypothetical protein [Curtobacterium sp. MCPF17_011]PZF15210.1 hypothetical protein DEJ25_00215 [Curtobacterium sp. MCPF17_011]